MKLKEFNEMMKDSFGDRVVNIPSTEKNIVKKKKRDYLELKEDLEYYYEIDLDNCLMTNIDWIEQIALLMTKKDYDKEILSELNLYIKTREEL